MAARILIKNIPFSFLITLLSIGLSLGCTRQVETPGSVQITLNLPSYAQTNTLSTPQATVQNVGGWGLADPTTLAQITCYGVMVGGPDYDQVVCNDSNLQPLFKVGLMIGAFPSTTTELSLDLKSGLKRKISIIGFAATSQSECLNFGLLNPTNLSAPHIIGSVEKDLVNANESVSINISMTGTQKFDHCSAGILPTAPSTTYPSATLGSLPDPESSLSTLAITVGGTDVVAYKYKVGTSATTLCSDSTGYGAETSIATNITNTLSVDGDHTLCVLAKNSLGVWQQSPTSYNWTRDSVPPATPTIVINAGATFSNSTGVTLSLASVGAAQMYITETAACTSGGAWESFTASKAWTIVSGDGNKTLYIKTRDNALNESSCTSDSISLDTTAPTSPTSLTLGIVPNSLTETPPINWGSSSDSGSGISHYEAIVYDNTNTPISSWVNLTSGNTISGLSLTSGDLYYVKVSAHDNAGNTSSIVQSSTWTASFVTPPDYTDLALGEAHTCAIRPNGEIRCWGDGSYYQLGDGVSTTPQPSSVLVSNANIWTQVSSSSNTTCAINSSNDSYCWGYGLEGHIGNGTNSPTIALPTIVSGALTWGKISSGPQHTCGITSANQAYCWGDNTEGDLGTGDNNPQNVPTLVSTGTLFSDIGTGWDFSCGLSTTGDIHCWGDSTYGQLGNGTLSGTSNVPVLASGSYTFIKMGVGRTHVCAIDTNGFLYCWGKGVNGALGKGDSTTYATPQLISNTGTWTEISSGNEFSCGIDNGALYCWGLNTYGQVGDNTFSTKTAPLLIDGGTNYLKVRLGFEHACGITTTNDLRCWGRNASYQVGDGTFTDQVIPTSVNP